MKARSFIAVEILGALFALADPIPQLPTETNWGQLAQVGKGVSIEGPTWQALGRIRADGTLYLMWVQKSTGRKAPSVYTIGEAGIVGRWGWDDEVTEDDDGTLRGVLRNDILAGK